MRSDARKRLADRPTHTPPPECPHGYTDTQITTILGTRLPAFRRWLVGQTVGLCDGFVFNHDTREYELSGCDTPHGVVVYPDDLRHFLTTIPRPGDPVAANDEES